MAEKVKHRITLRLSHFEVRGVADVSPWGGGRGSIPMKPFEVASNEDDELIRSRINDNGFGVQSINGAVCDVYAVYENADGARAKVFVETRTVGDVCEDLMDYALNEM